MSMNNCLCSRFTNLKKPFQQQTHGVHRSKSRSYLKMKNDKTLGWWSYHYHWLKFTCSLQVTAEDVGGISTAPYLYPTPSSQPGCDTRSIFKQTIAGLNSEFSFSKTGLMIPSIVSINFSFFLLRPCVCKNCLLTIDGFEYQQHFQQTVWI